MKIDYDSYETRLLNNYEGSKYTDGVHPYDPGGPTRWGITIGDARSFWKPNATPHDVETMPVSVAKAIYKPRYWDKLQCDALPAGPDDVICDYAVNSGVGRARKVLRRVVGLPDNASDQDTLAAVARRDPVAIINKVCDERLTFMRGLPIYPTYKGGWTARVADLRAFSIHVAKGAPAAQAPAPPTIELAAKAKVNPPVAAKNAIKTGSGLGAPAAGVTFWDWITAHPIEAAIIAIAIGALVAGIFYLLERNHVARQEAPTPGLVPVPELKPAI
jgi:lysozyme family protein